MTHSQRINELKAQGYEVSIDGNNYSAVSEDGTEVIEGFYSVDDNECYEDKFNF